MVGKDSQDQKWLVLPQAPAVGRRSFCSLLCLFAHAVLETWEVPIRGGLQLEGQMGKQEAGCCKTGADKGPFCVGFKGTDCCQGNVICVFVLAFWLFWGGSCFNKTSNILLANASKVCKSKPNLSIALHLSELR